MLTEENATLQAWTSKVTNSLLPAMIVKKQG